MDQIKRLDEQVRSRISEQKTAKAKIPFKSAEDVDRQIATLQQQVDSGSMKLVDEKKALNDISNLRKLRKNFGQFEDSQKQIDDLRAKIKEIKDSMEDPEQKAMSEQYSKIQAELDAIKAEQDEAYKNLSGLRDERTKLQAEQQETFGAIRKLKDDYYGQKKAFQAYEREARDKQRERKKAEYERVVKERKKAEAERVLAEASDPAYLEEIRRANSLLQFLDPEHKSEKGPLVADSGLGAQAQRTVDESGLKGTKLLRKEDREEEFVPAAKKGKKGKKSGGAASSKFFNCPPSVVEDCAFMGIDPPMSSADVPGVIDKVRAKLDHWKADQAEQTQRVSSPHTPVVHPSELTRCCRTLRRPRRRLRSSKRPRPKAKPTATRLTRSPRTSRRPLSRTSRTPKPLNICNGSSTSLTSRSSRCPSHLPAVHPTASLKPPIIITKIAFENQSHFPASKRIPPSPLHLFSIHPSSFPIPFFFVVVFFSNIYSWGSSFAFHVIDDHLAGEMGQRIGKKP